MSTTRWIYVKLIIYTVNRRIYRNPNPNPNPIPNPHIIKPVDTATATSLAQPWLFIYGLQGRSYI